MPPKINPILSEKEKEQIIKRYHELVKEMNADLPSNIQIRENEKDLLKRINNPSEVTAYRIALEANAKRITQDRLLKDLKNKYPNDVQTYGFEIARSFKVEDTPEAKAYNDSLYRAYIANPDKVAFARYSKVLNFDPKELLKLKDNKGAIAEFYRNNPTLCEDALTIGKFIQNNPNVLDEAKENRNAIDMMGTALGYPATLCNATTYDALACPDLTREQGKALSLNYLLHASPDINVAVDIAALRKIDASPAELFEEMEIREHIENPNNKDMMFRIEPIKYTFEQKTDDINLDDIKYDPLTHTAPCSLDEYLYNKDNPEIGNAYGVDIKERVPSFEIKTFTEGTRKEVAQEWGRRLFRKIGLQGEINDKTLENKYKGNIFERIGNKTSREYKNLLQAMKDYHDPHSDNYLNDNHLNSRAQAYINHKFSQGYVAPGADVGENQKALDGISLDRFNLAISVLELSKEKNDILKTVTNNAVNQLGFNDPVVENDNNIIQQDPNFVNDIANDVNLEANVEKDNNIIDNEIKVPENDLVK